MSNKIMPLHFQIASSRRLENEYESIPNLIETTEKESNSYPNNSTQTASEYKKIQSSEGLTFRRKNHIVNLPIQNHPSWLIFEEAKKKLRGLYCFNSLLLDLKTYGTSSHLFGVTKTYKQNLNLVMLKEQSSLPEMTVKLTPRWLFNPDEKWKQIWNIVILVLLMYVFLATPWLIAFEEIESDDPIFYLERAIDLIFLLDIFITLNTAYYLKDELIINRWIIFKNYLKGLLVIDLIAVFPFYLLESDSSSENSLVRIIRITKVSRIFRASKVLEVIEYLSNSESMENFIKFIKNHDEVTRLVTAGYIVIIMAHFTACMWYFCAKMDNLNPETWVWRHEFQDKSKGELYLASLYWAFTILTTVGFGDIHAYTPSEMALCILWMLFGIGVYSFLVGTLTSVLSSADASKQILRESIEEVERFCKDFSVPTRLLKRMKKVISLEENNTEEMDPHRKEKLLNYLPDELRYKIALSMNNNAAERIFFLKEQDQIFISNIVPRLEYHFEGPMELVYEKGSHPEEMFFIIEGRVDYILSRNMVVFKQMVQSSYFGEIELIEKIPRMFSVYTNVESEFLICDSELFEEILKNYTKVANRIIEIAKVREIKNEENIKEVLDLIEAVKIKKMFSVSELVGKFPDQIIVESDEESEEKTPLPSRRSEEEMETEDSLFTEVLEARMKMELLKNMIEKIEYKPLSKHSSPLPPLYPSKFRKEKSEEVETSYDEFFIQ